jgi:integrase/recombinase XerD
MDNFELLKVEFSNRLSLLNKQVNSVSTLTNAMLNDEPYKKMLEITNDIGEVDFTHFNDLELIHFYVHQQKDINENKNRAENTKKEYLRELLLFYRVLLERSSEFELPQHDFSAYKAFSLLNHRHIRLYQDWIKAAPLGKGGKPYSVATLNRKMVVLKGFLTFLFDNHYISLPLHQKMLTSNVRMEDRPIKELGSVEVNLLLNYFKDHPILHGLLAVLTTCGIRITEFCTARVCDLYYSDEHFWLTVVGKGNKKRDVLIHPPVLESIKRFRERRSLDLVLDQTNTSPLFTTAEGNAYPSKYLSNYLTRKVNEADLDFIKFRKKPITPHFFRHAFSIISFELGESIERISQTLGHNDIKTTMIYLERTISKKNNAAHSWKDSDVLKNI